MKHWFDTDFAAKYGVSAALIFEGIGYWVNYNEANDLNFFEGRTWVRNSRDAWKKLYPELSEKKIDRAIAILKDEGLIETGSYNIDGTDRTKWYTLTDKGRAFFDGEHIAETATSILPKGEIASYQKGDFDMDKRATCYSYTSNDINNTEIINRDNYKQSIVDIVAYLNERAGLKFKATSEKTQTLIKARLNEGYTVDDFKRVIDNKVVDWKDDHEMARFLRPMTLFGTKFESYLNQKTPPEKNKLGGQAYHGDSFDTDDFFEAALRKNYGDKTDHLLGKEKK